MYAQSTNNETCTRKQYCFFVVRHVGKARLDTLVTLDTLVSTRSTGSTNSNVSSRVESSRVETSQVEFGLKSNLNPNLKTDSLFLQGGQKIGTLFRTPYNFDQFSVSGKHL